MLPVCLVITLCRLRYRPLGVEASDIGDAKERSRAHRGSICPLTE